MDSLVLDTPRLTLVSAWFTGALLMCTLFGVGPLRGVVAAEPPPKPEFTGKSTPSPAGTVEGVVVYKQDPNRPWRYGRYYIKWLTRGHLAEAVVALRGRGLTDGAATPPATAAMDQKDYRFSPETLAIRVGDSVRFTNSDIQVHNVRTYDGRQPFNVNTPLGSEYTHRFDAAGGTRAPIHISCSYHGQMRAWIFVFPHRFFQVTGEDGKFRWEGVPPGEYELEMVHAAGNLRTSQRVVVTAGETTKVNITVSPDHLVEEKP